MPELPDVALYVEHLTRRLAGRTVERVRVASPFHLRTVDPPLSASEGKTIRGFRRLEAKDCATCQTGGRLLADRALSRLLKDDWPRTLEELEEAKAVRREA